MWCKDDSMVEVRCVILLDRGGAVPRRTEGKAISLLYDEKLNKRKINSRSNAPSRPPKNNE